jgi:hypothetical protein
MVHRIEDGPVVLEQVGSGETEGDEGLVVEAADGCSAD